MKNENRITVIELFNRLGQEIQNGNGDCFIQVSEYMLPKNGIHYSEIETTREQEEQMEFDIEKNSVHKKVEQFEYETVSQKRRNQNNNLPHIDTSFQVFLDINNLKEFTEYIAENLNSSIAYSEYISGKLDKLFALLIDKNIINAEEIGF